MAKGESKRERAPLFIIELFCLCTVRLYMLTFSCPLSFSTKYSSELSFAGTSKGRGHRIPPCRGTKRRQGIRKRVLHICMRSCVCKCGVAVFLSRQREKAQREYQKLPTRHEPLWQLSEHCYNGIRCLIEITPLRPGPEILSHDDHRIVICNSLTLLLEYQLVHST